MERISSVSETWLEDKQNALLLWVDNRYDKFQTKIISSTEKMHKQGRRDVNELGRTLTDMNSLALENPVLQHVVQSVSCKCYKCQNALRVGYDSDRVIRTLLQLLQLFNAKRWHVVGVQCQKKKETGYVFLVNSYNKFSTNLVMHHYSLTIRLPWLNIFRQSLYFLKTKLN